MDEKLERLRKDVEQEQALRRRRKSLETEYQSLCGYAKELAVLRQKEQEAAKRLESVGVSRIFAKVSGKYNERHTQECLEAEEAEIKYAAVQEEICQMEAQLRSLDQQILQLAGVQAEYDQQILLRAEELEKAGVETGIGELRMKIHDLEEQQQRLRNDRMKISDIRRETREVIGILNDAAGYGRWDVGRGSLLGSYLKQERVQKAKEAAVRLQEAVEKARDVGDRDILAAKENIEEVRRQRIWDIFLDNIFTDWNLQDEIEMALSRLYRFDGMLEEKERQLAERMKVCRIQQEDLQKQWKEQLERL